MITFSYSPKPPDPRVVEELDEAIKRRLRETAEQVVETSPYHGRRPEVEKTDTGYRVSLVVPTHDMEEKAGEFDPVQEFDQVNVNGLQASLADNLVSRALPEIAEDAIRLQRETGV